MDIWQVTDELVVTRRADVLKSASLRVLRGLKGNTEVATDPVGSPVGKWVFTCIGSAARLAMHDKTIATDLTICGIIDGWDERGPDTPAKT